MTLLLTVTSCRAPQISRLWLQV